jgi:CubicO group peptidase (beta-lactamase class C family)
MKFIKRTFLVLIVLLLLFSIAVFFLMPSLKVATGYAAKYYCSSKFLANHNSTVILNNLDFFPVNIASFDINEKDKSVEAKIPFIVGRKAYFYQGERDCGCVLDAPIEENSEKRDFKINTLDQDWPLGDIVTPSKPQGVNMTKLNKYLDSCLVDNRAILNVSLIFKDQFIVEKYQEGFDPNTRILGWSMTKSVANAVLGAMQMRGLIDVGETAGVNEWKEDSRAEITLNDLLQMNSGLDWEEDYTKVSDVTTMLYLESDFSNYAIDRPTSVSPGKEWIYSSGTSNILSKIIHDKFESEEKYNAFVYDTVLNKIGMRSAIIEKDNAGNHVFSSLCWATARDWTRFGLLYLNKGFNGEEQVFDTSWADYTIAPAPNSNGNYGAHIWLNKGGKFPALPEDAYYESGYGGQKIMVIPSRDLIIVLLSGRQKGFDLNDFYKNIISNFDE